MWTLWVVRSDLSLDKYRFLRLCVKAIAFCFHIRLHCKTVLWVSAYLASVKVRGVSTPHTTPTFVFFCKTSNFYDILFWIYDLFLRIWTGWLRSRSKEGTCRGAQPVSWHRLHQVKSPQNNNIDTQLDRADHEGEDSCEERFTEFYIVCADDGGLPPDLYQSRFVVLSDHLPHSGTTECGRC